MVTAATPFVHFGPLKIEFAASGDALAEIDMGEKLPDIPAELAGSPAYNPACLYAAFAHNIRNGTAICPSFEDGLARRRLLELVHRSDRAGTRLKVAV